MDKKKKKSPINNYARYSSMAVQMIAVVILGTLGGIKLDAWINWKFPVFTLVFAILSVFAAIYFAIKDFL